MARGLSGFAVRPPGKNTGSVGTAPSNAIAPVGGGGGGPGIGCDGALKPFAPIGGGGGGGGDGVDASVEDLAGNETDRVKFVCLGRVFSAPSTNGVGGGGGGGGGGPEGAPVFTARGGRGCGTCSWAQGDWCCTGGGGGGGGGGAPALTCIGSRVATGPSAGGGCTRG